MIDIRQQAVTGVTPPETGEAKIREVWPSVASSPAIAGLGQKLTGTIILAPLAWLIMAGVYFGAEVSDGALEASRTFWPARTRSPPSTTTRSPTFSPSVTIQSEPTRSSTLTVRMSTVSSGRTTAT